MCLCAKSLQSELTLCNTMDSIPPGSSVHGIMQARILGWVTVPSSRGSSWRRDQTRVSYITGKVFTVWAIRKAPYKVLRIVKFLKTESDMAVVDAFTQVCVRTQELKNWRGVTEEVMDDLGTAEWQAVHITCVNHRVEQSCCKSPCCHFQALSWTWSRSKGEGYIWPHRGHGPLTQKECIQLWPRL